MRNSQNLEQTSRRYKEAESFVPDHGIIRYIEKRISELEAIVKRERSHESVIENVFRLQELVSVVSTLNGKRKTAEELKKQLEDAGIPGI